MKIEMDAPATSTVSPIKGLPHRFLNANLAIIMLFDTAISYGDDGNPWRLLSMLGWCVFGSAFFLRPVVLAKGLQEDKRRTEELARITRRQSKILGFIGYGIVVVALIAKYARAA